MAKRQFPKQLYVTREDAGDGNDWLNAVEVVPEAEDRQLVAIYKLVAVLRMKVTRELK